MLLACPNCNTVFRIEKTAIGKGRKVNCGVCKHVWFASQDNLKEEKKVSYTNNELIKDKTTLEKSFENHIQTNHQKDKDNGEENIQRDPKPLLTKEINRSSEFDKKKIDLVNKRKKFSSNIRWFMVGILLSIALFAFIGVYFRNYIVSYYPKALKIYDIINIDFIPNIKNLEIIDFSATVDGDILIIKGKIYNNDFFSKLSPIILISGFTSNNELQNILKIKAENQIIESGMYNYFRYEFTDFNGESNANLSEFNAELSSESLNLKSR